ncbi:ABC transporter ATP-binding protein [Pollutimonas thiosulfatoxidans]|uniref:Fe3+/spermidine/putrescine ABC transporter ATP-binding protein n=1 Tax=Pollutimonas thiosulfatoxidans TaxID=2028345 RepID=A0A410GCZ6_9BURK|nr:ABC transporter ATP-binding protein [Pollutimonas thiosulfatoxidans]MBF6616442.1 ABC transporter ATP-binding protein [Candidimonas sp.]NYT43924.1 ABC transporter ATP-binding protein [Alcaligenaceae bacterium]QAA94182.1 Fe3+/spermidine/putrescine ABC transporter ATP-binding protein [Pollutimonas thiosulfatoxidans]
MKLEKTRVEVANCAKTFPDGTRALLSTNLVIEPGEVIALLGPSGCGKTTLLRLLAGLETTDDGGRISFAEQDVTHRPAEKRGVGMVFQNYALFPQMNVEANIAYGLTIRGLPAQQRKSIVGELIDLVRLNGLEKKRPAELSGGQRQRVALARAVAVRPRILLLDEPLAALDAKLKESLRIELAELLRRLGITAVHVTHDQQEALAIADRLAVMHAGSIVQIGDGESIYRKPTHPFVAQFLGRVNTLRRDAQACADGVLRLGGQSMPCPEALRSHTTLMVRPEDLQLGPMRAGYAQARIDQRVFLGDRVQFKVSTEGQDTLLVEMHGHSPFQAGSTVGLWVDPDRLLPTAQLPSQAG